MRAKKCMPTAVTDVSNPKKQVRDGSQKNPDLQNVTNVCLPCKLEKHTDCQHLTIPPRHTSPYHAKARSVSDTVAMQLPNFCATVHENLRKYSRLARVSNNMHHKFVAQTQWGRSALK